MFFLVESGKNGRQVRPRILPNRFAPFHPRRSPKGLLNISQNDSFIENDGKKSLTRERLWSVQKGLSSKATATLASGAYRLVREHDKGARTPLAAFFNTPPK
jgi:hypothetical protein